MPSYGNENAKSETVEWYTPLPQLVVFQPVEQTGDPREPKESRLDWAKKRTEPVARVCPWISVGYDDQTEPP